MSAAPSIEQSLERMERDALEHGGAVATIRGHRVAAIPREQLENGRRVRSIAWELDGAGLRRATLLSALTHAVPPAAGKSAP